MCFEINYADKGEYLAIRYTCGELPIDAFLAKGHTYVSGVIERSGFMRDRRDYDS